MYEIPTSSPQTTDVKVTKGDAEEKEIECCS